MTERPPEGTKRPAGVRESASQPYTRASDSTSMSVATEVWAVMALLHREHPDREDFSTREINAFGEEAALCGRLRPSFSVHVNHHCVANRPPKPARLRMLVETSRGRRRLFRPGDRYDPQREGGKTMPDRSELPPALHSLLDWYAERYLAHPSAHKSLDPILALRGRGKEIASDEHPDEYVRRLRRGWS